MFPDSVNVAGQAFGKTRLNALTPLLWLCLLVLPLCGGLAYLFRSDEQLRNLLVWVFTGLVVFACVAFAYFAITRPQLLQSEDFQLRSQAISLLQQQGTFPVVPASLEGIANPVRDVTRRTLDEE